MERSLETSREGSLVQIRSLGQKREDSWQKAREDARHFQPDIYWYLSFFCNLACEHCSVKSSPWVDRSNDLTPEEALRVVDKIAELNVGTAILSGGEFLLRADAVDILKAFHEKKVRVSIESNGLRFQPEFLEIAREMQKENRLFLGISLDGGTRASHERLRGPGSFDRTVRNLFLLKEQGIRFVMQAVLNRSNILTIPNYFELARQLLPELWQLDFAILNPVGRGVELVRELGLRKPDFTTIFELIKQGKKKFNSKVIIKVPPAVVPPQYLSLVYHETDVRSVSTCQFPLLGILPNGDVTICALSRENADLHFGNVKDQSLKEIWVKTRMEMLRSSYLSADHLTGICGDCVWKHQCKGGCRAWAYENGGDFAAPLPVCQTMADSGEFPKVYQLSAQNHFVTKSFSIQNGCCSAT